VPIESNKRIFWALEAFGIAKDGTTSFTPAHGVQNAGINTTYNLEQIFELGQLAIYEQVENLAEIEVTAEKYFDGYPMLYHLSTQNATSSTLLGRSNDRCTLGLSIFADTSNSASGTPNSQVTMSGMYISSVGVNIPLEGCITESVTWVGNNKVWSSGSFTFSGSLFNNLDVPLNITSGVGGVQRREDVIWGTNYVGYGNSLLPFGPGGGIPNVGISGTVVPRSDGFGYNVHVQSVNMQANFGREALLELGRKNPWFRFVTFPVEVTTDIEVLSTYGDYIDATEEGIDGFGGNLSDKKIQFVLRDGSKFDMGSRNKLSSVQMTGGDTGGANVMVTYSYTNSNEWVILHNQDPMGFTS
jgi:hypothetical protein